MTNLIYLQHSINVAILRSCLSSSLCLQDLIFKSMPHGNYYFEDLFCAQVAVRSILLLEFDSLSPIIVVHFMHRRGYLRNIALISSPINTSDQISMNFSSSNPAA